MLERLGAHANVEWLPRRPSPWGGFGHVAATLDGLRRIAADGLRADYVVLLTGQDYPLKSNAAIDAFFARQDGRSFLHHQPLPVAALPHGGYDRLARHLVRGGRVRPWPSLGLGVGAWGRRVPYGLQPWFGSGYWCLHREAVGYVMDFLAAHPRYTRFFRRAFIPDEMFFQTILANSPLAATIVDDDLRFIRWPGPAILTSADDAALAASSDLFARKFDERVDAEVLNLIDRRLDAHPDAT